MSTSHKELIPLKQWICDGCNQLIEKPEDGWVEWIGPATAPHHSFRIVHYSNASPLGEAGCYKYRSRPPLDESTMHLESLLGVSGMLFFLRILESGVTDRTKWAEFYRRLFVPYYEEARAFWTSMDSEDPIERCLLLSTQTELTGLHEETLRLIVLYRTAADEPG